MAQVVEISKKGLQRQFSVTVPADAVKKNWLLRLEEIGKNAKLPGFRPGKIPMDVLKKRFGESARAEILDQTVSEESEKAFSAQKIRPAMQPKIELVTFAEDKDLEFKVEVEVLPEIVQADYAAISLEKPVADVEESTVEAAILKVAKNVSEPELVTDDRIAKLGDILVIDFDGSVDGQARAGMKGQDHRLELGSHSFIDTFEDQLVGLKAGDKKLVKVTFPSDYHAKDLAAKAAEFKVDVKELRVHKTPVLNDELAKEIGFPSLEKLQERVRDDLKTNYDKISRSVAKRRLMNSLSESQNFEIPVSMLDAEFNSIWQQIEESKKNGNLPAEDAEKSDETLRKEYRDIAARRIRLGLLLADLAQKQKIEVAPPDLRNALMAEARRYPGQEKAVIDYYTQTSGAMERLRAPLLEEKVVDYILSLAKVTDKKIPSEELLKMPDEDI